MKPFTQRVDRREAPAARPRGLSRVTRALPGSRHRVLVVDDSVVVRQLVARVLDAEPAVELAGVAAQRARSRWTRSTRCGPTSCCSTSRCRRWTASRRWPRSAAPHPTLPVIIFSHLTSAGAAATLDALALGATDFAAEAERRRHRAGRGAASATSSLPLIDGARPRPRAAGRPGSPCPRPHARRPSGRDVSRRRRRACRPAAPTRWRRSSRALPADLARADPHRPAHAGGVHQDAGRAARPSIRGHGRRSRRRRAGRRRSGLHRPRRPPHGARPARRPRSASRSPTARRRTRAAPPPTCCSAPRPRSTARRPGRRAHRDGTRRAAGCRGRPRRGRHGHRAERGERGRREHARAPSPTPGWPTPSCRSTSSAAALVAPASPAGR